MTAPLARDASEQRLRELIAAVSQPAPSDRIVLANAAMKTAVECLQAKDYGAAHAFIEDALAQVRALRGLPVTVREGG